MSNTQTENPEIPLVGLNGNYPLYTSNSAINTLLSHRRSPYFTNVGSRLARRKLLFLRRRKVCDVILTLALFGIVIMIIDSELRNSKAIPRNGVWSYVLRSLISASTLGLLGAVFLYHKFDVQVHMLDNNMDEYLLAVSLRRALTVMVEVAICIIHPFPNNINLTWTTASNEWVDENVKEVPLDVILSLPMFLRLYLICRSVMLHHRLYTDASSQSLGALNEVPFNFQFIFKSIMSSHAEYVLMAIVTGIFIISSWCLRECERERIDDSRSNMLNSMWLMAITFLSVGYGDVVPHSYCGRVIAVLTGMSGAGCTALVVALMTRKLQLSQSEKYVHDFVIDIDLQKQRKHAAASIVKTAWKIYRARVHGGGRTDIIRRYQRKLIYTIHVSRELRAEQRRLHDGTVTLIEISKAQNRLNLDLATITQKQNEMDTTIKDINGKLGGIESILASVCPTSSCTTK